MQTEHHNLNAGTRTRAARALSDRRRFLGHDINRLARHLHRSVSDVEVQEGGGPTTNTVTLLATARALGQKAAVCLPRTQVIAMVNNAGGVGKTSMTRELAFAFNAVGLRVLMIDADSQANLTDWLGFNSSEIGVHQTIFNVLTGQSLRLPTPIELRPGLHLLPSTLRLYEVEDVITEADFLRLRDAIGKLEAFDVVLIDACPNVVGLGRIAAISADQILVPLTPTDKGIAGLRGLERCVPDWRLYNPALRIGALIVTKFEGGTSNDSAMLGFLRTSVTDYPVLGPIPKATAFDVAQLDGRPVAVSKPRLATAIYGVVDSLLEAWQAKLVWPGGLA